MYSLRLSQGLHTVKQAKPTYRGTMSVLSSAPVTRLSLAGVRSHRGRFASLVFAIFTGVLFIAATLVITDTVQSGFASLFGDAYRNVSVVVQEKSTVVRQGETFRGRIDGALTKSLRSVAGVAAVSPRISGFAYVVSEAGITPPNVTSDTSGPPIAENWIADRQLNPYSLVSGRAPAAKGEVVIDRGTAKETNIKLNEPVGIVSKEGTEPGKVVGIVRFGSVDSPGAVPVVLFTDADAERLLGEPGRVDAVFVRSSLPAGDTALAASITKALPKGVEAITGRAATKERENSVAAGLRFITAFLLIFAVLSLVVGAFIIANTFAISISQRSRELALLRAIGGSRSQMFRMVLGEAAVMSVVGSVTGLLGGIGLASLLRSILRATGVDLPESPLIVRSSTVAWSLGIGILITLFAAVSPALKAGRISPVAAMRDSEVEPPPLLPRSLIGLAVIVIGAFVMRSGALAPNLARTGLGVGVLLIGTLMIAPAVSTIARLFINPSQKAFGTTSGLAVRNATRNPRRTASTALALSLGSAVACFALILNASLQQSLAGAVGGGLKGDLVVRSGTFGVGGLPITVAGELLKIPSVEAVSGVRYGFATVTGPKRKPRRSSAVARTGGRPIASLDPRYADRLIDFGNVKGNFSTLGKQTIALSQRELDNFGWNVGDKIALAFPGKPPTSFTISSVFRQGLAFDFAIGNIDYEKLVADQFDFVEYVAAKPGTDIAKLQTEIEAVVAKYPTAKVVDPKTYAERITSSLDQLLSLIFGLLVLVVAIAVIGIAITLSLSVVERLREIGMLRALGMYRSQLRSMLRSEAIVISLIAVTIGVALGTASSWALLRALRDEGLSAFAVPPVGLIGLALLAAVSGLVASIVPARRAARLPMLHALAGIRTAPVGGSAREETFSRTYVRRSVASTAGVAVLAGLGIGILVGRAQTPNPTAAPTATVRKSGLISAGGTTPTSTSPAGSSAAPASAGVPGDGPDNNPYDVPATPGPGKHGTLRAATPIDAPQGMKGWRVLFDSTYTDDRANVVSGLVYAPDRPAPPQGWPVLSFAHPTTGLADRCAPSKAPGILETTVASLTGQANMVMVASDYPGLGTDDLHPFLDGPSSGRSVLDAALAAGTIDGLKLAPTTIVWGHSQGGHAALFAGQLAKSYTPSLDVRGVVAGAPPSQLRTMVNGLQKTPDRGYALLVASGMVSANPQLKVADVLTPRAIKVSERLDEECSGDIISAVTKDTLRLPGPIPADWLRALDSDEPGRARIDAPVFIIHGGKDELVPVESSAVLAKDGHADVALTSLTDVLTWVSAQLPKGPAAAAPNAAADPAKKYPGARGKLLATLSAGEKTPLVIAHAGGDLEAPHSTPYAFKRAMQLGVDVLEMDVRLSSDGVLVVHHDPDVDRTTNETGTAATRTARDLAVLDNAHWFTGGCWDCRRSGKTPPFRGVRTGAAKPPTGFSSDDFRIATFDDIVNEFPEAIIDIEIKADGPDKGLKVARTLAKRLKDDPASDRFIVVSFDDAVLAQFRQDAPNIATSPGFSEISQYVLAGAALSNVAVLQVPPSAQGLPIFTDTLRAKAAADGIAIWVWPSDPETDDEANYKSLLALKPNGIIAGRPEVLKRLLGK
jgi:putative ABC transport system permease protein